ncbi:MAG: FGGY family carbohydrate kinase [Syntrophotaleaceae bacterium]
MALPSAKRVVWQDRRTAGLCDRLKTEGPGARWQEKTGLLIDPYFSATKVHWLLEKHPGLRERAAAGEIAFGTVDSWLVWRLTGGHCHVTDYSNASRTLLYNIHGLDWDEEILARLDIPGPCCHRSGRHPSSMPKRIVRPFSAAGADSRHRRRPAGRPVRSGLLCSWTAKSTYGTSSFLLLNTTDANLSPAVSGCSDHHRLGYWR